MTDRTCTMYLDQSAHLDWDWIDTFDGYYESSVRAVLEQALANLAAFNTGGQADSYYSICEMGYLYRFVTEDPSRAAAIQAAGENFQVVGGGITSPDCLVCSGEGFVRNYLVGRLRLAEALPGVMAKPYCEIPDDFGQDPELPVLLQALGFPAVVFGRLPGTFLTPQVTGLMDEMLGNGVDVVWRASDGSQAVAHWMLSPDGTGNYSFAMDGGGLRDIGELVAAYGAPGSYPAAATPFMYFSVENDFSMPVADLLEKIDTWNASPAGKRSGVLARAGTFADFIEQVLPLQSALPVFEPYAGIPYWTGYFASRPALKTLHYETVRRLLEAEVFGLLARDALPATYWSDVAAAWTNFAPSTHHDYVCGTACDEVYAKEQLPLLRQTAAHAGSARATALAALAGTAVPVGSTPVVVANGLGFARTDLAELPSGGGAGPATQPSFEGGTLFMAYAPSFGFATLDLASSSTSVAPALASIAPETSGSSVYTLANEHLQVTVSEEAGWGIGALIDAASGADVLAGVGNELVFYVDGGDIYTFGNENAQHTGEPFTPDSDVTLALVGAEVLEAGPLRVRLRTTVTAACSGGAAHTFTREYALVAGEPFVRMTTTGAAFLVGDGKRTYLGSSVMTRFRLAAPVANISHGTGGHWTDVQPSTDYWGAPIFRATHDFLLAGDAGGQTLAAAYHGGMPAWAFDEDGALLGCLLRNTPGNQYGASGTDTAEHTQRYALRVPSGLAPPSSGQPLREARRFSTPPRAVAILAGGTGTAASGSVAAAADPAILTVAKPGSFDPQSLVLRLYQPTNAPATVQVTLGSPAATGRVTTALEGDWEGPATPLTLEGTGFSVQMSAAIATVQVT